MDNAQQWRDIVTTALKVALVMYILDRMRITSDVTWFGEGGSGWQRVAAAAPSPK